MTAPLDVVRRRLRARRLVAAGAGVALLAACVFLPQSAQAAYDPSDYPSWSDVQNAKGNEAATAAEVDKINALLDGLRAQAAQLGDEAIARAGEADAAAQALDEATQRVTALESRAASATADAESARTQAGRLAAQLYRNGGTDATLNLLVGGAQQSSQLLYKLGTMTQLTAQSTRLQDAATAKANLATSLGQQAEEAKTQRASLAAAAEAALEAAQAAEAAAEAQVAEQESRSTELYAQLASLKNTTAQVEQEYADGQAAKASYEQQQRDAEAAALKNRTNTESSSDPDGLDSSPATIASLGQYTGATGGLSPAEAQAYAATQMPAFGWGQDQMSCLIPLWNGESNWRWNALNSSSGAYGIPQSLPASKMGTVAADYRTNAVTQVTWGLSYIKSAYGSPCTAWAKWQARSPHWY